MFARRVTGGNPERDHHPNERWGDSGQTRPSPTKPVTHGQPLRVSRPSTYDAT